MGGLSYLKRFLQVLLFSFPAVLSCLLIHCLLTFSALPHCPRAWLRLKLSVMTIHRNFNWGLSWGGGGRGEKELSVRTWGSARPPPAFRLSPLIPGSHPFFDCKILSIAAFKHFLLLFSYHFHPIRTPSHPFLSHLPYLSYPLVLGLGF